MLCAQLASYLKSHGFKNIPVNPNIAKVLGKKLSPLLNIAEQVDVVDIFRRSEFVPETVDQAIQIDTITI